MSNPYDRKLQNSTDYVHPNESNLLNVHKALDYTEDGKPALRVVSNIQGNIIIEGEVNVPGEVAVKNVSGDSLDVNVGNFPQTQNISGSVSIDNFPETQPLEIESADVRYLDGANLSAFSRLRTAGTRLLGEFRNQYGTMGPVEIVSHFENGGEESVDLERTNVTISATDANGSRALRQSRKYHPYIPGTTNLALISFTMQQGKANLHQSVGLFDDLNGIFFRLNGTTPEMVIRKDGADDQVVPQSEWNIDKLDGTGASKIALDFTKSQIFVCDYQWLGVGRVRVGFNLNGQFFYTHYFTHANQISEPYLFQPSLPVRWEIKNVGPTDSPSTMMCIAYGVYVEGSDVDTGFENGVSNGTVSVTLGTSENSIKGLLAVRLKNTVNDKPNRAFALLKDWQVVTSLTAQYKVLILQSESDLVGTPTWTDSTPTGWTEFTTDFRLAQTPIPDGAVVLFDGYATGSDNRGSSTFVGTDNRSSAIYQNFDSTDSMIIAIVAYRIPNDNARMKAALNWIEIK